MKGLTHKTKVLLCVIFFLLVCSTIISIDWKKTNVITSELVLKEIIPDVSNVIINFNHTDLQQTINIKKIDESFFLYFADDKKYKVPETTIANFFSVLTTKNKMMLISRNAKTSLTNGTKVILRNASGTLLSDITFGEVDTLGINRYVMLGDGITVYKAPDIYSTFLKTGYARWIETQPFKTMFKTDSIQSVTVDNIFTIKNERNARDFAKFEEALSALQVLDVFAANESAMENDGAKYRVECVFGSGRKVSLVLSELANSSDYILRSETASEKYPPYTVSAYAVERLIKTAESVKSF